jgi:hypothetical protein
MSTVFLFMQDVLLGSKVRSQEFYSLKNLLISRYSCGVDHLMSHETSGRAELTS